MGYKFNPLTFLGLDLAGGGSGPTTYKAPVANSTALPSSDNTDGDVRVTLDTGDIWVWNDGIARWINNSTIEEEIVGSTPNANGYSLVADDDTPNLRHYKVVLQPADASNPGIITTSSQTISGSKTLADATTISDTTSSSSKDTGALVVEGGVGVEENLNVGGDVEVTGELVIQGNFTVNGTTSTVNTETLDVEDANITVNKNGNQASANTQHAGITVEMSDATNVDIGFDSALASKFHIGEVGDEREIVSVSHTQTLSNKTIDSANNTITIDADEATVSNLETDNLKAGVLNTDTSLTGASDTDIPSTLAVKTYIDNGDSTVQSNLDAHINDTDDAHDASAISNVPSGNLAATNLQDAVDELQSDIDTRALDADLTAHINDPTDAHAASAITNTPTGNLVATNIQDAVDELQSDIDTLNARNINTNADSGLTGGGNLSTDRDLSVDINGTTEETSIDVANDEVLVYDDSASALRKTKVTNLIGSSTGDLSEQSATFLESQTSTTIFTLDASVRSAIIQISVFIDATTDVADVYQIQAVTNGTSYSYNVTSTNNSDVIFDVNASGEVRYTSTTYTGFSSGVIKYRVNTTTI